MLKNVHLTYINATTLKLTWPLTTRIFPYMVCLALTIVWYPIMPWLCAQLGIFQGSSGVLFLLTMPIFVMGFWVPRLANEIRRESTVIERHEDKLLLGNSAVTVNDCELSVQSVRTSFGLTRFAVNIVETRALFHFHIGVFRTRNEANAVTKTLAVWAGVRVSDSTAITIRKPQSGTQSQRFE